MPIWGAKLQFTTPSVLEKKIDLFAQEIPKTIIYIYMFFPNLIVPFKF